MNNKFLKRLCVCILGMLATSLFFTASTTNAENVSTSFIMSPMYEKISLNPGESYSSGFTIATPSEAASDFNYKIYIQGYYRDENNNTVFEDVSGRSQIADWIEIISPETGTLKPNSYAKINFTINVPENASAGGQYAVITVGSATPEIAGEGAGVSIQESVAIGYTIYAEITGTTIKQGEITEINVPGFLFSGNIAGTASIKNTGNVHSDAKYTLQVFPLFSNEEVYTNVETPETHVILPDRTLYNETAWDHTPWFGVFNVLYTVEFNGVVSQVSKLVIVCPIWLLFTIIFAIVALIIWFIIRFESRKKQPVENSPTQKV